MLYKVAWTLNVWTLWDKVDTVDCHVQMPCCIRIEINNYQLNLNYNSLNQSSFCQLMWFF